MNLKDAGKSIRYFTRILARGFLYEETEKRKLEYETILQNISKLTQLMIGWRTVAIATAIALPTLTKSIELTTRVFYWPFIYFGGALLVLWMVMDTWLDKIIAGNYPTIRELECHLGIEKRYKDAYKFDKWSLFQGLFSRTRFIHWVILIAYLGASLLFWLWD